MSKKIWVIDDEEEFKKRLNLAIIESRCVVADVMDLLEDYEREVIEFEAKIKHYLLAPFSGMNCIPLPESMDAKFNLEDDLQVFVLKPKKPEGKDEKENLPKM